LDYREYGKELNVKLPSFLNWGVNLNRWKDLLLYG
jgi:hypothetical protein